jgi:hypothetical protein
MAKVRNTTLPIERPSKKYDPAAVCQKCGCLVVSVEYKPDKNGGIMARWCATCGHHWNELPLDAG